MLLLIGNGIGQFQLQRKITMFFGQTAHSLSAGAKDTIPQIAQIPQIAHPFQMLLFPQVPQTLMTPVLNCATITLR
jgi:hypothetical protein